MEPRRTLPSTTGGAPWRAVAFTSTALVAAALSCSASTPATDAGQGLPGDAEGPLADVGRDALDAGPGDAPGAKGRLYAFVTVERWQRANVQTATMGAIVPFHLDAPAPGYRRVDPRCIVHYETDWRSTGLTPPSFGAITIDGVKGGSVTWQGDRFDQGFDLSPDGFGEGDVLTVRSTGGDVPPFTFKGAVPGVPVLTSHDNLGPGPSAIRIPRSQAMSLTWTPVKGEILVMFLQGNQPAFAIRRGIHCFFPGEAGAATVPAAALGELLSSREVDTTNFYFGLVQRDRRELADIDVDFLLWNARQTRVTVDP